MKSVQDVVDRIYRFERWRFGVRNAEDAKQQIWVAVLEAMRTADASRSDVHLYLRYQATKRLRRDLAFAHMRRLVIVDDARDVSDARASDEIRAADRMIELRWRLRSRLPTQYHDVQKAFVALTMVVQGASIDEAAGAVYHSRSIPSDRRRKLLEDVHTYGGAT